MRSSAKSSRNSLICFWEGYLGVSPSIVGAIKHLSDAGISVEVLMLEAASGFPQPPTLANSVRLRIVPCLSRASFINNLPRCVQYPAVQIAKVIDLLRMIFTARRLSRGDGFRLVVGVDRLGMIVASAVPKKRRRVLVCWSLELRSNVFTRNPISRLAKKIEKILLNRADTVIVQDTGRANLLVSKTGINTDRIAFVPNSPSGLSKVGATSFLHDRLGLTRSTKIILHAGMISPEVMSLELAKGVSALDDPYVLVFHERQQRNSEEPYLRSVQMAGGSKVKLSLAPVSLDDVDKVYASAFIGIVIYSTEYGSGNYSEVAFASGKLGYLLHNRVPVIVNAIPSLERFVEQTGCGLAVNDLREIPSAVDRIARDYEQFKEKAERAFLDRLDFAMYFRKTFGNIL